MAICERCGRNGMGILHSAVRFKDGKYVCAKCLKDLGHEHPLRSAYYLSLSNSEDVLHPEIKWKRERQETCRRRADRLGMTPDQYDSLDRINATEFEIKMFSRICALLDDDGCSSRSLILESGDGGSIYVLLDGTVLFEYKGEPQVKWIRLFDDPDQKIRFGQLSRLNGLADRMAALYRKNA